jgi:hypothetical protein
MVFGLVAMADAGSRLPIGEIYFRQAFVCGVDLGKWDQGITKYQGRLQLISP